MPHIGPVCNWVTMLHWGSERLSYKWYVHSTHSRYKFQYVYTHHRPVRLRFRFLALCARTGWSSSTSIATPSSGPSSDSGRATSSCSRSLATPPSSSPSRSLPAAAASSASRAAQSTSASRFLASAFWRCLAVVFLRCTSLPALAFCATVLWNSLRSGSTSSSWVNARGNTRQSLVKL